jgi:hypothetical protein
VINAVSAVQTVRVAQYAGRDEEQDASGAWIEVDYGVGHVWEFASDCFGPMLAMGTVAADHKVHIAAVIASKLPVTLAAMSVGDLDSWRATIIADELAYASRETCAAVEAIIYPTCWRPGLSGGESAGSWAGSMPTRCGSKPLRIASTGSCMPFPPMCPA